MTTIHINANMIQSGTISAAKITSVIIDKFTDYENEVISFDEYSKWGNSVKNCVINSIPQWSSFQTMIGKIDKDGNIFAVE